LLLQGRVAFFTLVAFSSAAPTPTFPPHFPPTGFGFVSFTFHSVPLLLGFSAFFLLGMLMTLEAAPKETGRGGFEGE